MEFNWITAGLLVVATITILIGLKILFKTNWIAGFLRGASGLSLLAIALFCTLIALNLSTYNHAEYGKTIANVSISKADKQSYRLTVSDSLAGGQHSQLLEGDMWRINIRDINVLGSHFTKLNGLNGRFYALGQHSVASQNDPLFISKELGLNLWQLFKGQGNPLLTVRETNTPFTSLVDEALFAVIIDAKGLRLQPLNTAATVATAK